MFGRYTKQLQILRKHLPGEVVDALASILSASTFPLIPRAPMILSGVADQSSKTWTNKRTTSATEPVAFELGPKAQALFEGRALGIGKWCKTVAAYTSAVNPRSGKKEYTVQCRDADDEQGLRTTGTIYTVYLAVTGGAVPKLNVGDTMFFFYGEDGLRVSFPSETATEAPYEEIGGGGWGVI